MTKLLASLALLSTTAPSVLAQTAPKPLVVAATPHHIKAPFVATRTDEYY